MNHSPPKRFRLLIYDKKVSPLLRWNTNKKVVPLSQSFNICFLEATIMMMRHEVDVHSFQGRANGGQSKNGRTGNWWLSLFGLTALSQQPCYARRQGSGEQGTEHVPAITLSVTYDLNSVARYSQLCCKLLFYALWAIPGTRYISSSSRHCRYRVTTPLSI